MYKAYYKTPIGYAEIIANERAILSVSLVAHRGDHQPAKNGVMKAEQAEVPVLKKCIKELDEYFKGKRKNFTVELEKRGTDFQKNVWNELEKIPFGTTASYEDVAVKIGNKKAVRAVGLANSKNPHWIIVPCHRVIGKNKKMVGYAGGLDVKKWLLEHEGNPENRFQIREVDCFGRDSGTGSAEDCCVTHSQILQQKDSKIVSRSAAESYAVAN